MLEFSTSVCIPYLGKTSHQIERILASSGIKVYHCSNQKIYQLLLPLSYDREMKDLTYFFKLLNGFYDLNISNFVSFVSHKRTRNCKNPSLVLKVPSCKTISFQSSFFNRIVPLWNYVCKIACPADLRSLTMFKSFLLKTYVQLLVSSFNVDMPCTWSLYRSCSCYRSY